MSAIGEFSPITVSKHSLNQSSRVGNIAAAKLHPLKSSAFAENFFAN
jgi:hypothetical protein